MAVATCASEPAKPFNTARVASVRTSRFLLTRTVETQNGLRTTSVSQSVLVKRMRPFEWDLSS